MEHEAPGLLCSAPGGGAPFGVPSPQLAPIPLACSERPGLLLPHKNDQKPSLSSSVSGFLALGRASSGAVCPAKLVGLQKLDLKYVGLNW